MMKQNKLDLSLVHQRKALTPKADRTPHYDRLRPGLFLGYRPTKDGTPGNWAAKAQLPGKPPKFTALPSFGQFPDKEQFAKAKAAAEAWMAEIEAGPRAASSVRTVADAARKWVEADKNRKDPKPHPAAARFFKRSVYDDPIGEVPVQSLTKNDLLAWRERLEERPGRDGKGFAKESINREMSPLRAALRAYVTLGGPPGTDGAWQEALTKIRRAEAKRQRHLYLDPADRRTLLASTCDEASPFFRALAMLPIRPGAMSDLTVASFSPKTGKLQVGWDKGHPPRIVRITAPETLALFIAQTKGKTPAAPLFSRANGDKWTAYWWKFPMRDAREAAGLPEETIAYTLRHCVITDMVKHGAPTLAIAKMAGTSVEMIEEYYAHELDSAAQEALAAVAAAI